MSKMRSLISKLSNLDTEDATDELEKNQMIVLNQLIITLIIKFLFLDFVYNLIIKETIGIITFPILSAAFIWSLRTKLRFNPELHFIAYILLSFIIFIFTSNTGKYGLVYLNYIPLLVSIPLIFDVKGHKIQIIIILISIIAGIFINLITGFELFAGKKLNDAGQRNVAFFSLIQVAVLSVIISYFLYKKFEFLKSSQNTFRPKENKAFINKIPDEELMALAQLAREDRQAFMQKAIVVFSDFYEKICHINSIWVLSELEVCFLLKLNFTTKDIAQITNSSVRAIEAKRYRIRKKLNIPSDQDISIWLNSL